MQLRQVETAALTAMRQAYRHFPLAPVTGAAMVGQWAGTLGDASAMLAVLIGSVVVTLIGLLRRSPVMIAATLCALLALWLGYRARLAVLPESMTNGVFIIEGKVVAQQEEDARQQITFDVQRCTPLASASAPCNMLERVRLSVGGPMHLAVGERWRLQVRLKPPHGMANPGQWDSVWRVRRQGVGAVGSVLYSAKGIRLAEAGWQLAEWLKGRIQKPGLSPQARRWLLGMILGDGSAFDDSDWQRFNDTGTTHLAVVSGSHVTLAVSFWAMLLHTGMRYLWPERHRLMSRGRALATVGGIAYAMLAQGGAPAARACVALLPWVLSVRSPWRPSRWHLWWLALLGTVLWVPWALLMPGVWLSFGAVAALYVMHPRHDKAPSLVKLLKGHVLISLLMEGALLFITGRWAPLSPLANLVAIPWISLLLMPLGMLGALLAGPLPWVAHGCWVLFDIVLSPLVWLIDQVATLWPSMLVNPRPAAAIGIGIMMASLVWALPAASRGLRLTSLMGVVLLWLGQKPLGMPAEGDFTLTVMDVGQGQLVEIRTHGCRYLFDTGPQRYGGRRVIEDVWPAAQHFDAVIVSHGDLDHAGGIPVLMAHHDVMRWWAPWRMPAFDAVSSGPLSVNPTLCRAGIKWVVDGVRFRFLWPLPNRGLPSAENDRSCILLVEGKGGSALLTGDASSDVEQSLLQALDRPISIWVAGHHGSRSSNSRALLMRMHPLAMLYSAGHANVYHHPSQQTRQRAAEAGARQWNTAETGAIVATVHTSGEVDIYLRRDAQTVVIRRL